MRHMSDKSFDQITAEIVETAEKLRALLEAAEGRIDDANREGFNALYTGKHTDPAEFQTAFHTHDALTKHGANIARWRVQARALECDIDLGRVKFGDHVK